MKNTIRPIPLAAACAALALSAAARAADFPEGAATMGAADIKQRLDDKVFAVQLANGNTWRLEYKANGYFFVNVNTGFQGNGEWTVEDGKVCSHLRGNKPGCNEVRLLDNVVHLKRDSGEIIRLVPR